MDKRRFWWAALVLFGLLMAIFTACRSHYHHAEALIRSGVRIDMRRRSTPPSLWEPLLRAETRWKCPDYPFQIGYTPLMTASICGDVPMATLLLNRGADINAIETEHGGPTPLLFAVKYRHQAVARLLLDHGADPNGAPGSSRPLLYAWLMHDQAMIDLLLHRGARPLSPVLKENLKKPENVHL